MTVVKNPGREASEPTVNPQHKSINPDISVSFSEYLVFFSVILLELLVVLFALCFPLCLRSYQSVLSILSVPRFLMRELAPYNKKRKKERKKERKETVDTK